MGLNFLPGGYAYSTGAALADPTVNLEDGQLDLHMPVLGSQRSR